VASTNGRLRHTEPLEYWPSTDRVNIDEIDFLSGIMIEPNFQIEEGEIVGNSGATHWDAGVLSSWRHDGARP
jgi:hypothetical protein